MDGGKAINPKQNHIARHASCAIKQNKKKQKTRKTEIEGYSAILRIFSSSPSAINHSVFILFICILFPPFAFELHLTTQQKD